MEKKKKEILLSIKSSQAKFLFLFSGGGAFFAIQLIKCLSLMIMWLVFANLSKNAQNMANFSNETKTEDKLSFALVSDDKMLLSLKSS